jgi:hypothetical protein
MGRSCSNPTTRASMLRGPAEALHVALAVTTARGEASRRKSSTDGAPRPVFFVSHPTTARVAPESSLWIGVYRVDPDGFQYSNSASGGGLAVRFRRRFGSTRGGGR